MWQPAKTLPITSRASGRMRKGRSAVDFHKYGSIKSLQAVVLAAGSGSRMTTLVSNTPKCMLPIASVSMLYYPLRMLEFSGFKECIVVVNEGQESAVQEMAKRHGLTLRLNLHHDSEQDRGTLDSLRHISTAFSQEVDDVLIVSSDLISDVNIDNMVTYHRVNKSALTMLVGDTKKNSYSPAPGLKPKFKSDPDQLCESVSSRRLCFATSGGDYGEHITFDYAILKHGQIAWFTGNKDVHAYIIRAKLFRDYVLSPTSPCVKMSSFKAEVIPHLVNMQFRNKQHAEYDAAIKTNEDAFVALTLAPISCTGSSQGKPPNWASSGCRAYSHTEGLCVRANTIPAFWHINTKLLPEVLPLLPQCSVAVGDHSKSEVQPKAVVKGNTLVREGCVLSDRTTVTDSSLGRNCVVKPRCRVTNSVIFDNVTLEPGTVVEDSIVCCSIDKENCTINNSIVAATDTLQPDGTVEGDTLEATQFFD